MRLCHMFLRQRENCFLAWRQESNIRRTTTKHKTKTNQTKKKANPHLWCNKYWHYLTISLVVLSVLICSTADPVVQHLLWKIKVAKAKKNFCEILKKKKRHILVILFRAQLGQFILFLFSCLLWNNAVNNAIRISINNNIKSPLQSKLSLLLLSFPQLMHGKWHLQAFFSQFPQLVPGGSCSSVPCVTFILMDLLGLSLGCKWGTLRLSNLLSHLLACFPSLTFSWFALSHPCSNQLTLGLTTVSP